uniref:Transmembrane protein n=1 Tax=Cacopsylla melanoneura TaxID=428564 RepID=A0A8D8PYA1_9HEMI
MALILAKTTTLHTTIPLNPDFHLAGRKNMCPTLVKQTPIALREKELHGIMKLQNTKTKKTAKITMLEVILLGAGHHQIGHHLIEMTIIINNTRTIMNLMKKVKQDPLQVRMMHVKKKVCPMIQQTNLLLIFQDLMILMFLFLVHLNQILMNLVLLFQSQI